MAAERSPDEIQLVAVSKTVGIDRIQEAIDAGQRVFGENKIQEGIEKIKHFRDRNGLTWHFIGTLQKNKAKKAVEFFDVIESVDSLELLEKINTHSAEMGKVQKIFIQVKLSEEESKHGISQEEVEQLAERAMELQHIELQGLMTIPPYFDDAEEVKPYFVRLREIKEDLAKKGIEIRHLSMGMSNDYEAAIREGATHVRVGTAIFGERAYT